MFQKMEFKPKCKRGNLSDVKGKGLPETDVLGDL